MGLFFCLQGESLNFFQGGKEQEMTKSSMVLKLTVSFIIPAGIHISYKTKTRTMANSCLSSLPSSATL